MSDESDSGPQNKRKRKVRYLEDSPSSSSSNSSGPVGTTSRGHRRLLETDESCSDSGSSIEVQSRKKRVARVVSDADSDSSGSVVVKRTKRPARVVSESDSDSDLDHGFEESSSSQWESDFSDVEQESSNVNTAVAKVQDTGVDSDSSDGQSEKCPICLLSLKSQEIGTPETCDHMFCVECIQEWSKNVNTCPVDRQEFKLILVRKNVNGSVYRILQVEPPNPQNEVDNIFEDPTFCEICGSSEREDRMLLCDGCDLGFHLECLTPPLEDVPAGAWYCNECSSGSSPENDISQEIELFEVQMLLDEAEGIGRPTRGRRNTLPRLVPRTRQSERVRRRIENNRSIQNSQEVVEQSLQRRPLDNSNDLGQVVSSTTSRVQRRTVKRKKKRRTRYKIVYEIDEVTGETIAVKKKTRTSRKRRKTRRRRERVVRAKTVKKRLARQLGICPPRIASQNIPDVKVQSHSNSIGIRRQQAGIPTLHLFGQRDELDYFSPSEDEIDGPGVLIRRAPNRSDVAVLRRASRVKAVTLPNSVSSTSDILDSILDSQKKFHSKSTIFSLDKNGKFTMEHSDQVRFNNYDQFIRRRPTYSNSSASNDTVPSSSGRRDDYPNNSNSPDHSNSTPTSTVESNNTMASSGRSNEEYNTQDYSQRNACPMYDMDAEENKDKKSKKPDNLSENNTPRSNTPCSESEIDIYSDIETVSTSKVDEGDLKPPSPIPVAHTPNTGTDDENNDSEPDMVIDTEKVNAESEENTKEETTVTSTVDSNTELLSAIHTVASDAHSTSEIQSEAVQSSNQVYESKLDCQGSYRDKENDDDEDSEDGCPNFSIYSKESIILAKNTDVSLNTGNDEPQTNQVGEISSSPAVDSEEASIIANAGSSTIERSNSSHLAILENKPSEEDSLRETQNKECEKTNDNTVAESSTKKKSNTSSGLYSDSEDETIVKKNVKNSFGLSDIRNMTEDISEEERSYTPCLDERVPVRGGLEGLDTEMISDEDRNDFDESHDLKTVSDGDALEINAKESELDFTRPEDYEEGEIVDKTKSKKTEDVKKTKEKGDDSKKSSKKKDKEDDKEKSGNKENEGQSKESTFKKLSKNNKERNYRDKDRERSKSREKKDKSEKESKKEKKKEKRKEIERYDVRALIAEKPRRLKDKFGRDIRRSATHSRSRSLTPRRSPSRSRRSLSKSRRSLSKGRRSLSKSRRSLSKGRRSLSREWNRKKRGRSRTRRSLSRSKSRSAERKRSRSKGKKRRRSISRDRSRRRKSRDRSKAKKKQRSRSRHRSRSLTPKRRKEWNRRHSRDWTPSLSRSRTPEPRHLTPSWTPPRILDNAVKPHNLTVILTNDSNKKKKEKKKKADKKTKENERQKKRKRNDRTPPPSKEVFASGDNILVSVSFNKENETRDVSTKRKREVEEPAKRIRKEKRPKNKQKKNRDLSGIKPVAIIDLERSPFKELTPSPKDVIVLSDSDNEEANNLRSMQKGICDSSQQVASPERCVNNYSTGPKTPPEPQIKFTLTSKQPQMRAISNPLHEPDDIEPEGDTQEVIDQRIDGIHKGPNTPPEPPNSPPSSPDAYDPFEPTKSRSPTPEPLQTTQSNSTLNLDDNRDDSIIETRSGISEMIEKSSNSINQTPDALKSHTPPLADVQPADSQSSIHATPESNLGKSPERSIGPSISQSVQSAQPAGFPIASSKPVAQTIPFSSVPTSIITSTPVNSNLAPPRINILNTTIITPPHVASSIPNRIVLPNAVKSSPVKISPTKPAIKSMPIKPMPSKTTTGKITRKSSSRNQNGSDANETNLNFESPYSPGSSDYEDLFEPPVESPVKPPTKPTSKTTKSPVKAQNAFDSLFGSSPFNKIKTKNDKSSKFTKKPQPVGSKGKGTKQVGVKLDEDNLKILDELPNSAVEMQVKDKFLKKLNRQERVVEEVKLVLKPHYNKKHINKEEYKDILRRAVPKICHNKSGEINPTKIKNLIEAYVKKVRHSKKVTSSSSVNPQKA